MRTAAAGWALLGVLLAPAALSQEPPLRAEVDARKIGLQDRVQLTVTLEGSAGAGVRSMPVPPLRGLRLVAGPSMSTQVSIVNGRMSQSQSFSFVLQPTAVGEGWIGPVRVSLEGVEHATEPITIEVVAGSLRSRRADRRADPFGQDPFGSDPFDVLLGRRRGETVEPKLFIQAQPSRQRVFVGEPVLLTYSLYTQVSVTDVQLVEAPQYPGFWAEDLERDQAPEGELATVEGERYRRFPVLRKLLFPTKAGTLTIPPAAFRLGVRGLGFFDPGALVERSTEPSSIQAQAIPDQPDFSGAVGQFRASASVDRDKVALGDAVTLRFTVKGSGNLKWVDRAPEPEVENVKLYPPQVKSDLKVGPEGMSGSKTWEFVVVPETTGELTLPPLAFAYFDPKQGRIVRSETAAIPLRVGGVAGVAAVPLPAPAGGVAREGRLPLRTELDRPGRGLPVLGGRAVALGLGLALLLHGGLWAGAIVADRRRRGLGRSAARPSVRRALADLARAGRARTSKEASAALIEKTLHDLFGPLGTEASAPAGERERAALEVLREVEFLRYAPQLGDYSEKIREVAARASEVVRRWA